MGRFLFLEFASQKVLLYLIFTECSGIRYYNAALKIVDLKGRIGGRTCQDWRNGREDPGSGQQSLGDLQLPAACKTKTLKFFRFCCGKEGTYNNLWKTRRLACGSWNTMRIRGIEKSKNWQMRVPHVWGCSMLFELPGCGLKKQKQQKHGTWLEIFHICPRTTSLKNGRWFLGMSLWGLSGTSQFLFLHATERQNKTTELAQRHGFQIGKKKYFSRRFQPAELELMGRPLQVEWCKAPSLTWKGSGYSAAGNPGHRESLKTHSTNEVSKSKYRAWLVSIDYLNYFYIGFSIAGWPVPNKSDVYLTCKCSFARDGQFDDEQLWSLELTYNSL